ncbi:unnamed protein product [Arabidopsis lyrata]|nr:unnamed protein product [Arabidopsis lyrata]
MSDSGSFGARAVRRFPATLLPSQSLPTISPWNLNLEEPSLTSDSPRGITHDFQSLKNTLSDSFLYRGLLEKLRKNGIMIPSPRSGGYRIFLNPLSLYPLFTELIHVQIINFRDYFHTLNALKLRSGYFLYVLSRLQALCGILNLHGIAHVREDPPVLLRLYTHILRTLVLASSGILKDHGLMLLNPPCGIFDGGVGSFSNDHSKQRQPPEHHHLCSNLCQSTTLCSSSRAGEIQVFGPFTNAISSLDSGNLFIH